MLYGRIDFILVRWVGQIFDVIREIAQLSNRCQNCCEIGYEARFAGLSSLGINPQAIGIDESTTFECSLFGILALYMGKNVVCIEMWVGTYSSKMSENIQDNIGKNVVNI